MEHMPLAYKPIFVFLTLFALLTSGCATAPITNGIPNLAQVEPGVWRGGQPTAAGWEWLKAQGVIFDLKLNTESEGSDALAETNGLHVIRLPITFEEQTVGRPKQSVVQFAASCIDAGRQQAPRGGIFVHCEHGQDRTSLIVGTYRVTIKHWKKADAYREMLAHGFHPALLGLQRYWDEEVQ